MLLRKKDIPDETVVTEPEESSEGSALHIILPVLLQLVLGVILFLRSSHAGINYLYALIPMLFSVSLCGTYAYNHNADMKLFGAVAGLASIGIALQILLDQTFATLTVFSGLKYGIAFAAGICFIPFYSVFRKLLKRSFTVYLMMAVSASIYIYLYLRGIDVNGNGTTAWISVSGYTIQLTDFTKIAAVFFYSSLFSSRAAKTERGILTLSSIFFLMNMAGSVLIRELGSFFILYFLHLAVLFIFVPHGQAKRAYLIIIVLTTLILIVSAFILYKALAPAAEAGTLNAIERFIFPFARKIYERFSITANITLDPYGSGYQLMQGRKALWMAGLFGNNVNFSAIPVAESDMAYIALVSSFGWTFGFLVVFLFMRLMRRGAELSIRLLKESRQDAVAVFGITMLLFAQAMLVILGSCNVIPFAGLPIPFLSRGGTYLAITFCFTGLLIHLSEEPDEEEEGGDSYEGSLPVENTAR